MPRYDSDTPVLVEHSPECTNRQAPELGEMTVCCLDGGLYESPWHVRTVIESACDETAEGLNCHLKASVTRFKRFNRFLRTRHKTYIDDITEELDTGRVMVRIATVGTFSESRLWRFDCMRWALGQRLQ